MGLSKEGPLFAGLNYSSRLCTGSEINNSYITAGHVHYLPINSKSFWIAEPLSHFFEMLCPSIVLTEGIISVPCGKVDRLTHMQDYIN